MMLQAEVKEWGNSYGLRLTKKEAERLALKPGDAVSLNIVRKRRKFRGFGICKGARPFVRENDLDRY